MTERKRPRLHNLRSSLSTLDARVPTLLDSSGWRISGMTSNQRGYTYRWQKASKAFLAEHPLCQCPDCDEGNVRITVATVVDHHIPHRGDGRLFWDVTNWRAMAKPCHDRKTQTEGKEL